MVTFDKNSNLADQRAKMVEYHLKKRDIVDADVLETMAAIQREEFVPENYENQAYSDQPLPIGLGQTISQPYIVALMTQVLKLNKKCEVLEIGTGSGYQTAILCKLAKKVYTIERHNQLIESAQNTLSRLNIGNVEYFIGDGSCGWPEQKIFDRIIITAAVPEVPGPVMDQLAEDGLLVAPVGGEIFQELTVFKKHGGSITSTNVCGCKFVKLIGKHGF
ncbi:MAG: protein-L-isoaspartate(D-aspartate) O-methyltransferase, partial [Sedimentisphaerales bacterium]|nr:protein-L-isoaspartate(D-aspartate) O-methyltransferase [Sedimentisphaerales bacterium]